MDADGIGDIFEAIFRLIYRLFANFIFPVLIEGFGNVIAEIIIRSEPSRKWKVVIGLIAWVAIFSIIYALFS